MPDISNEIREFQEADYGEDVRDTIINLANKLNDGLDDALETAFVSTDNPVFTGSVSMGRAGGSDVGIASTALGYNVVASGNASHAEGNACEARKADSHAEGIGTIADSVNQHVQGQFNKVDSEGDYAHIVGNGTDASHRSNAHTVDWDGNAWFRGEVRAGGSSYDVGANRLLDTGDKLSLQNQISGLQNQIDDIDDTLVFDDAPTRGSDHLVKSGGIANALSTKANAADPVFNGTISMGRKPDETDGVLSTALGYNVVASGNASHAEGTGTIAASPSQHVEGQYNVADNNNTYAHILGIGTGSQGVATTRANGHTVDWSGNAWYAGQIRVGGNNYQDGRRVLDENDKNSLELDINVVEGAVDTLQGEIDQIQSTIVFDDAPTSQSDHLVSSGAVYSGLYQKVDKQNALMFGTAEVIGTARVSEELRVGGTSYEDAKPVATVDLVQTTESSLRQTINGISDSVDQIATEIAQKQDAPERNEVYSENCGNNIQTTSNIFRDGNNNPVQCNFVEKSDTITPELSDALYYDFGLHLTIDDDYIGQLTKLDDGVYGYNLRKPSGSYYVIVDEDEDAYLIAIQPNTDTVTFFSTQSITNADLTLEASNRFAQILDIPYTDSTITQSGPNPVRGSAIYSALAQKADISAPGTFTKDASVGSSTIIIKAQQIGNVVFLSGGGVAENALGTYTTLGQLAGVSLPSNNAAIEINAYTTDGDYHTDYITVKPNGSVEHTNSAVTDARFIFSGFYIV